MGARGATKLQKMSEGMERKQAQAFLAAGVHQVGFLDQDSVCRGCLCIHRSISPGWEIAVIRGSEM